MSEPVDDELVVYDTAAKVAHALSAEAASVWARCDGTRSSSAIARELRLEHDLVEAALVELCGLLEKSDEAAARFSRREMGARLSAAALLGPLIYSAAIPPLCGRGFGGDVSSRGGAGGRDMPSGSSS